MQFVSEPTSSVSQDSGIKLYTCTHVLSLVGFPDFNSDSLICLHFFYGKRTNFLL